MNVGELRRALERWPDDWPVELYDDALDDCVYHGVTCPRHSWHDVFDDPCAFATNVENEPVTHENVSD